MCRFPHSTVHTFSSQHPFKNFCRGSPQKQVSTRSKIHSLREKTLQFAITSFRQHTTYKNCRTVKFRTHQLTTRGRSTQQRFAKTCPKLGIGTLSTLRVWEMRNFPPYLSAHRFVFGFSRALLGSGEWRTLLGVLHRQHSTKTRA